MNHERFLLRFMVLILRLLVSMASRSIAGAIHDPKHAAACRKLAEDVESALKEQAI